MFAWGSRDTCSGVQVPVANILVFILLLTEYNVGRASRRLLPTILCPRDMLKQELLVSKGQVL
jgi:hypothetical protein